MTQEDAKLYADAVKEWQHRKTHFFLFSHDDRNFKNWIHKEDIKKDPEKKNKINKKALIIFLFVFILIMVLLLVFSKIFRYIAIFCIVSAIILLPMYYIYSYIMYLNYTPETGGEYFGIIYIFCGAMAQHLLSIETRNVFIHVVLQLAIFYGLLRLAKNISFDLPEPRPEQFEKSSVDM